MKLFRIERDTKNHHSFHIRSYLAYKNYVSMFDMCKKKITNSNFSQHGYFIHIKYMF